MNCYDAIDLMDTALDDALPADARPGFASHLEECAPCRTYFGQLGEAVRALGRLRADGPPPSRRADLVRRFREQVRRDLS